MHLQVKAVQSTYDSQLVSCRSDIHRAVVVHHSSEVPVRVSICLGGTLLGAYKFDRNLLIIE